NFKQAILCQAGLSGANLSEANLESADLSGANLSQAELNKAKLMRADLESADLSGANFIGADLSEAKLIGANLSHADLSQAILGRANLSGTNLRSANLYQAVLCQADLSGADLSHANLSGANLGGANLSAADLSAADLGEAKLIGADLSRSNLNQADFIEADLTNADLSNTILYLARIIRCQLLNAIFENADVTDCQVQETRGIPNSPSILKVRNCDPLTGEDARNFFNPPATVEVYLSSVLRNEEIGLFHFHLGEMQHRSVGAHVHFVGWRVEANGTVLRFQAPTYEDIYSLLPVLLAPFRMSQAVDWGETLRQLPGQERGLILTELARIEAAAPQGVWRVADRLAQFFGEFPYARLIQIRDGRHLALRIEVATNQAIARKLTAQPKRSAPRSAQKNEFHLPGGTVRLSLEDRSTSQEIKAGENVVAATGEGNILWTGDVVFPQVWNEQSASIDLPKLADDLVKLRAALQREATEPEHDVAIGNVSMAAKAAKEGNGPKALEYLKAAGKWALDTATKVGVSVASDEIPTHRQSVMPDAPASQPAPRPIASRPATHVTRTATQGSAAHPGAQAPKPAALQETEGPAAVFSGTPPDLSEPAAIALPDAAPSAQALQQNPPRIADAGDSADAPAALTAAPPSGE
ncbi:MAG: pentapeptide repeat-containing protein, partial [Isosphaeraceae bacterium]